MPTDSNIADAAIKMRLAEHEMYRLEKHDGGWKEQHAAAMRASLEKSELRAMLDRRIAEEVSRPKVEADVLCIVATWVALAVLMVLWPVGAKAAGVSMNHHMVGHETDRPHAQVCSQRSDEREVRRAWECSDILWSRNSHPVSSDGRVG